MQGHRRLISGQDELTQVFKSTQYMILYIPFKIDTWKLCENYWSLVTAVNERWRCILFCFVLARVELRSAVPAGIKERDK